MKKKTQKKQRVTKSDLNFVDAVDVIMKNTLQEVNRQEDGKTISIDALPDCSFKTFLTLLVQDAKTAKICAVAFLNPNNKWDAYAGYPDIRDLKVKLDIENLTPYSKEEIDWRCENIRGHEEVLMLGEKLPKDIALILFPDWAVKEYGE